MTRADWTCKHCGGILLKTSDLWLVCDFGCGRLIKAPTVYDLPDAYKTSGGWFCMKYPTHYLKYVPHAHKNALDHAPGPDEVVARIRTKRCKTWEVRVFRIRPPK